MKIEDASSRRKTEVARRGRRKSWKNSWTMKNYSGNEQKKLLIFTAFMRKEQKIGMEFIAKQ